MKFNDSKKEILGKVEGLTDVLVEIPASLMAPKYSSDDG